MYNTLLIILKMIKYDVYKRFGNSHTIWIGQVEANNAKEGFKIAVQKFFEEKHYSKYTEFYVSSQDENIDDFDKSYGYDFYGQRYCSKGFRTSAKWLIDNILNETN